MCSSQVFHCLLNCLGPGTLLPIQRPVHLLVSHTSSNFSGQQSLSQGAPETQDPFVEIVVGLYSVSQCSGMTFYMWQNLQ